MKALAIDPDYAPAHAGLGWIAMYGDNDLAGAARAFKHALALDPADLDVLGDSAALLAVSWPPGRGAGARGGRRPPRSGERDGALNLGHHQRMAGRLDAAIASFRTVLSLSPGRGGAHDQLGVALLLKGDAQGALAEIEQETSEVVEDDRPADGLPRARAQGRLRRRARRADREVREGLRPTTSPTSTPSAARPTRRSRGSTRRSSTATPASARS